MALDSSTVENSCPMSDTSEITTWMALVGLITWL
jgi:hypothetical protein